MIFTFKNTSFNSNTYLITNEFENECLIIDPGINYELADTFLDERQIKPIAIICTHGHFDHIASVSFFKEKYNIPFYIHEKDLRAIKSANFFIKIAKINFVIKTLIPDVIFKEENTTLNLGSFKINVSNFPGHSPGSCIIQIDDNLFSGDILYKKGLGFNQFPDEDKALLKESIKKISRYYVDKSIVYPGHGGSASLETILNDNKELVEFLKE